jgi:hypothetical protein
MGAEPGLAQLFSDRVSSVIRTGLVMSNRRRRENGRLSKDDLKTQREYADAIGVSPGYVSKRTEDDGRLVKGRFDPFLDARFENGDPENGTLLGYTDPTDRTAPNGEASQKNARKAVGGGSRGNDSQYGMGKEGNRRRGDSSSRDRASGQTQQHRQSERVEELERALGSASRAVAEDDAARRTFFRLLGAAGGALLGANLVGFRTAPVFVGSALGFAVADYSIRTEQTAPQEPTKLIGLSRLSRSNVLPPDVPDYEPSASS